MDGKRVILAAHRGDRAGAPENTMAAFRQAIELGAEMIETDVRETADGELVLIHDRSTYRTSGVDKNVDEMTLDELGAIDVGSLFSPEYCGERVPTVREFMELVRERGTLVNWELKVYPRDFGDEVAFGVADRLCEMIFEYRMESRSMLNCFSARVLQHIKEKYGDTFPIHGQGIHRCRRSYDEGGIADSELFDWCCLYPNEKGGRAIDCPENFEFCAEHGVIPCICIPDRIEDYRRAIELGCRMFTTNDIRACDAILRELGVR